MHTICGDNLFFSRDASTTSLFNFSVWQLPWNCHWTENYWRCQPTWVILHGVQSERNPIIWLIWPVYLLMCSIQLASKKLIKLFTLVLVVQVWWHWARRVLVWRRHKRELGVSTRSTVCMLPIKLQLPSQLASMHPGASHQCIPVLVSSVVDNTCGALQL